MKATTMTLSQRRQSVFPQDWCKRVGLARGGPVNVFDLGETGLLIRPVKPPTRREIQAALAAARPRRAKPGEAERIVAEALRKVREADGPSEALWGGDCDTQAISGPAAAPGASAAQMNSLNKHKAKSRPPAS